MIVSDNSLYISTASNKSDDCVFPGVLALKEGFSQTLVSAERAHAAPCGSIPGSAVAVFLYFKAVDNCLKKFSGLIKKCFNGVKSLWPAVIFIPASFPNG